MPGNGGAAILVAEPDFDKHKYTVHKHSIEEQASTS